MEKRYNTRLVEHFITFSHEFDKFNNTGARMLYSIISLLDATPCDNVYTFITGKFWPEAVLVGK